MRIDKAFLSDGLRFLIAGLANTLLTLAVYQLLLFAMPPWAAYALSWVGGLLFVVTFYPTRVFAGARRDTTARVRLGVTYAAMFLLGLATLQLLGAAGAPPRLAILLVLAVTTAANFLLGRLVLKPDRGSRAP